VTEQTIKVELYTLSTCPWCKKSLAWLEDKHVVYEYVDYDLADGVMQSRIQEEMAAKNATAFPFAKFGETDFIVGYNPDAYARLLGLEEDAGKG